jgi:hypothetical protein
MPKCIAKSMNVEKPNEVVVFTTVGKKHNITIEKRINNKMI